MAMQTEQTNILTAACAPNVRVSIMDRLTSVSEKRGISQTHRLSSRMLWMPVRQPANSSAIGNTS